VDRHGLDGCDGDVTLEWRWRQRQDGRWRSGLDVRRTRHWSLVSGQWLVWASALRRVQTPNAQRSVVRRRVQLSTDHLQCII